MIDPNEAYNDALKLRSYELDQAISQSQVLYFASTTDGFKTQTLLNNKLDSNNYVPTTDGGASCLDNYACKDLGLTGLCCPTSEGINLGCCDSNNIPDKTIVLNSHKKDNPGSDSCSNNMGCASLGLTGQCCPTTHGITLSCCD